MRAISILVIGMTVAASVAASISAIGQESISLDQAVEAALANNPDLAAARHAHDAARARPPQAATPPDPSFMVDFIGVPTDTADVGQGTIQYMGEQQIPFPAKLVYGYKAEARAAEAERSRKEAVEQELIRQVKRAYLDVWRLEEEARIERETLATLRQSKGSAEASYAAVKGPVADPVRASVEIGEIEGRLAVNGQERQGALSRLSSFMARPLAPELRLAPPPPAPVPPRLSELLDRARTARPEVGEAQHEVESQHSRVALAKSQYAPDFVFRLGYMDSPAGQPNAWYGRVGMTVPLWSLSKQRFGVRESQALLARAQSLKDSALLAGEAEIRSAHARWMAARKTADVYGGTVVPRAQLLVRSVQEAYATGTDSFLSLVDAVRRLNDGRLMLVRARAESAQAAADLDRAVGSQDSSEAP